MQIYTTQWEDDENNRIVELSVRYRVDGDSVSIESVTPASVTFVEAESGKPVRKIRIHTQTGQRMLLRQFESKVGMEELHTEVSSNLSA